MICLNRTEHVAFPKLTLPSSPPSFMKRNTATPKPTRLPRPSEPKMAFSFLHSLLPLLLLSLFTPALSQCPDVLPTVTEKVINGRPSQPTFHISLSSPPNPLIRRCTASRISRRWALTAAHCLVDTTWTALLAAPNVTHGTEVQILQVFTHPNYHQPTDRRFDIAVLHLDAPEPEDEHSLVYLNSNSRLPAPRAFVRLAGYGENQTTDPSPSGQLTHVDIPVVPFPKCAQLYAGTPKLGILEGDKQLCAGYMSGGCDACAGDSGGPIIQFDNSGLPVQVALISASRGCAMPKFPGIGVRVDAYLPWLQELGAVYRTSTPEQVFRSPSASSETSSPPPIPSRRPVRTPDAETGGEPGADVSPTPGRRPGRQGGGKPGGTREPATQPTATATPEQAQESGEGEKENAKPSEEVDEQKGETVAGDASGGGDIEGGGVNGGIIAGGVIGGLLVVAVFIVGGLFFVKNNLVVASSVPRIEPPPDA